MMGYYGQRNYGRATPRVRGVRIVLKDYDECARVWASHGQAEGRTPGGRMFFEGDTIFSYGSHFPLARRVTNEQNVYAMLVNCDSYSNTTSKHKLAVQSAINTRFSGPVFYVPTGVIKDFADTGGTHAEHLGYRTQMVKEMYDLAMKARTRKREHVGAAMVHIEAAKNWAKFFSLPEPFVIADTATKFAFALDQHDAYLAAVIASSNQLGATAALLEVSARHLNIGG